MSTGNGSAQILDDLALAHALADLADAITLDRYHHAAKRLFDPR